MKDLVWLDLCSGLGGASQPALDRGWKVIRVDIDPRFKPDIVADVRALPLKPFHVDVLWASPPCTGMTFGGRYWREGVMPDLSPHRALPAIIKAFKPTWWIIENVWLSRKFLVPIYGRIAAYDLSHTYWGRLPCLLPQSKPHKFSAHQKAQYRSQESRQSSERAKIPHEIGEAICRAVETRTDEAILRRRCGSDLSGGLPGSATDA